MYLSSNRCVFPANQARGGKVTRAGEEEFDEGAVFNSPFHVKTRRFVSKRTLSRHQDAPLHVVCAKHVHFCVYLPSNHCVFQQIRLAAEKSRELEKKNLMKELSSNMREEDDEFQRKLRRYSLDGLST